MEKADTWATLFLFPNLWLTRYTLQLFSDLVNTPDDPHEPGPSDSGSSESEPRQPVVSGPIVDDPDETSSLEDYIPELDQKLNFDEIEEVPGIHNIL